MNVKDKIDSVLPAKVQNVETSGRIVSIVGGSILLYDALVKSKSVLETLAAGYLIYRGATGYCPASSALSRSKSAVTGGVKISTKVTVLRPRDEVYEMWRDLENLPLFMKHLDSVKKIDARTSEWEASALGNMGTFKWRSTIVKDIENKRISWKSVEGSDIENTGSVRFVDVGALGTEVEVDISYKAPGGAPGKIVGKLLTPVFESLVRDDIQNFKRYAELTAEHA